MQFILIQANTACAQVAERQIVAHNEGSQVVVLRPGDRGLHIDDESYVVPGDVGGLRWADLTLCLGAVEATWAALPRILETTLADSMIHSDEPVTVLNDSFRVAGSFASLFGQNSEFAARPKHLDGRAWGGFAPGLLVAPTDLHWADWWSARVVDHIGSPRVEEAPWWELPVGSIALADPALCVSTASGVFATLDASGLLEDGREPVLMELEGFDPHKPWSVPTTTAQPSHVVADSPGLRGALEDYGAELLAADWQPSDRCSHVVPGVPATPELRAWYRRLLSRAEPDSRPPNPFVGSEAEGFVDLLTSRGPDDVSGMNLQVDLLLEARDDLLQAFPHPRWKDREGLTAWLWGHGLSELAVPLAALPDPRVETTAVANPGQARLPFGVNLVGYLAADLGLGVAARRMKQALDAAGIPNVTVSYDRTSSNLRNPVSVGTEAPYRFNLLLITPDQLPLFVGDVGAEFLAGHHNIGLWYWESDVAAPQQEAAIELVDEIWVATNYLTNAFSGHGKPVTVVPSPLVFEAPEVDVRTRRRLGLDDRFTFLFSFDFLSEPERKNAIGLAEAYRSAFPEPGDTALLIKSINGEIFPDSLEHLRWEVADRDDIIVRDELLAAQDRMELVAAADCYVSLHRSEGLGLTMAEAMAVGTPVIATAYSGNLDFMPEGSALLVPASEVEVGPGHYYPAHGHWADPDLNAAAAMMRQIKAEPQLREDLALAGRRALEPFGFEQIGSIARDALMESWNS